MEIVGCGIGGPPLRALTLTQPWASLIAAGAKHWETRSWRTRFRGELAIHAARNDRDGRAEMAEQEFREICNLYGLAAGAWPLGEFVAASPGHARVAPRLIPSLPAHTA